MGFAKEPRLVPLCTGDVFRKKHQSIAESTSFNFSIVNFRPVTDQVAPAHVAIRSLLVNEGAATSPPKAKSNVCGLKKTRRVI